MARKSSSTTPTDTSDNSGVKAQSLASLKLAPFVAKSGNLQNAVVTPDFSPKAVTSDDAGKLADKTVTVGHDLVEDEHLLDTEKRTAIFNQTGKFSEAQLQDEQDIVNKNKGRGNQDSGEEETTQQDDNGFLHRFLEITGIGAAAAAAHHLWHHRHHRLRLLWRLARGKRYVEYVREDGHPLPKDDKPLAKEGTEASDAAGLEKEAANLQKDTQAEKDAKILGKIGQTGEETLDAEHTLTAARGIKDAGTTLRTATEGVEGLEKLSKITKFSRKPGLMGLVAATVALPFTAAIAWSKTTSDNMSNEQMFEGAVNVFKKTFLYLNDDWLKAFGEGNIKEGLDKFFGVSDSIRLVKLAHDDPEAFKKEMREMAQGASQFADWAQKNPDKLNKLLQDPEKYMNDPQFAKAVGTAVNQGLEGNRQTAQTSGLTALERAQALGQNGPGARTYKQMTPDNGAPSDNTTLNPDNARNHIIDRAHEPQNQPTRS